MGTQPRHSGQPPAKKREAGTHQPAAASSVPPNQLYDPTLIASTLERARGMVTVAARLLRCSRQTIYNAVQAYPEVKAALEDARELQLDTTELKLFEAIDKGQAWAICYYLKTQGRKRGYIEKVEHGADGLTLEQLVLLSLKMEEERARKAGHA